jgi:hypothetical protein
MNRSFATRGTAWVRYSPKVLHVKIVHSHYFFAIIANRLNTSKVYEA